MHKIFIDNEFVFQILHLLMLECNGLKFIQCLLGKGILNFEMQC